MLFFGGTYLIELKEILQKLSILYIEDDIETRKNVTNILRVMFKAVYEADNGIEGFDIYKKKSPDIILTDIEMPEMDGIEFIKEIRENDTKTQIIIMSAYDDTKYLLEAIKLKLEDYIIKPFSYTKLINVLKVSTQKFIESESYDIEFSNGIIYKVNDNLIINESYEESLTLQEGLLLNLLIKNRDKLVTYEMIEESVWRDKEMSIGALRTLINRVKNKLGKDSISSKSGVGYKLEI